ncbi:MAG: AAA family ATPase [Vicinamibacterales bacterium]
MLIGLPAAGKTTLYRERFAATHRHISKDLMPNVRNKMKRQAEMIAAALAAGESFVVDNTNATRAERAAIIEQALAAGARVTGYLLDVTTREAVARNRTREGKARVPDVAIFTVAKKLEAPVMDEGFDEIISIR